MTELIALIFSCSNGRVDRLVVDDSEPGIVHVVVVGQEGKLGLDTLGRLDRALLQSGRLSALWRLDVSSASPEEAKSHELEGGSRRLLLLAGLHPCEVLQSPLFPLVALEDPALWQQIRKRAGLTLGDRVMTRLRSYGASVDSVQVDESVFGRSVRARFRLKHDVAESCMNIAGPSDEARWVALVAERLSAEYESWAGKRTAPPRMYSGY